MKHKWIKTDFTIEEEHPMVDVFSAESLDSDFHNGPRCERCKFEFCHHCFKEGWETKCGEKSLRSDDGKLSGGMISMYETIKKSFNEET